MCARAQVPAWLDCKILSAAFWPQLSAEDITMHPRIQEVRAHTYRPLPLALSRPCSPTTLLPSKILQSSTGCMCSTHSLTLSLTNTHARTAPDSILGLLFSPQEAPLPQVSPDARWVWNVSLIHVLGLALLHNDTAPSLSGCSLPAQPTSPRTCDPISSFTPPPRRVPTDTN